jgi:hypothetical protein
MVSINALTAHGIVRERRLILSGLSHKAVKEGFELRVVSWTGMSLGRSPDERSYRCGEKTPSRIPILVGDDLTQLRFQFRRKIESQGHSALRSLFVPGPWSS